MGDICEQETAAQRGGREGATFGLALEDVFASRTDGIRHRGSQKKDVSDGTGMGHSIKNTRSSASCRWVAKSYSCISDDGIFSPFRRYTDARQKEDPVAEGEACAEIADSMKDPVTAEILLRSFLTGNDSSLTRITVYDNRTEETVEDFTGTFRSFEFSDVIAYYLNNLSWKPHFGKKHWSVVGTLPGFSSQAMVIELGSTKRKVLLCSFKNVQTQLDHWVDRGIPCRFY